MPASIGDNRRKNMTSQTYTNTVISSLNLLRENDELCDFTICAQGKSFRVNVFKIREKH